MQRKQVTIHYRRLEDITNSLSGRTLEDAVRAAMQTTLESGIIADHWKERTWLIPPAEEDTLLINNRHDSGDCYFGDLTLYSRGHMQALLREEEDSPVLDVEQQPAPEGQEYVHSIMYWMIKSNHAFIIQSQSLQTKNLEAYLTWFLKEKTTVMNTQGHVILQAKFDSADVGGDLEDIKEIIVGGATTRLSASDVNTYQATEREILGYQAVADTTRTGTDRAIEVLKAIMNNEADVMSILNNIPDEANLEVSVHIGYKTRKRSISRAPMQQALRNLPEGEIQAIGKLGRLTGNDIRLTHPASILKIGSLLDPEDALRALRSAYNHFVENGKIEP